MTSYSDRPDTEFVTRKEVNELLALQEERFALRLADLSYVRNAPRVRLANRISLIRVRPAALVCLLVAGLFFLCTWPGLFIGFDNDDVTNLHRAWQVPPGQLMAANLVPFTSVNRPAGAAYYRLCYSLFGWRPAAFRTVTYSLLLANLILIFLVTRRLTGFSEIGALSAILYSFHGRLRQLYMSNGAVYDILCVTLVLLFFLYYLRWRESGRAILWWQYAILTWLFIAAVNAKEMAAVIPVMLFLYEWIYHPPVFGKLTRKYAAFAAFLLLLSALAYWGKQQPGSDFHNHPLYTPAYTVRRFFENERFILDELFYLHSRAINTTKVVLFYTGVFGLAAVARRKHIWFAAWFFLIAQLPAIFIPYRGFFVMYLPMTGLAIYLASVLVHGRNWIVRTRSSNAWAVERVVTFLFLAAIVPMGRNRDALTTLAVLDPAMQYIAATHDDIINLKEPLPPGARVLLMKCRYPNDSYGPLMMMRLLYNDRTMWVDRPTMMATQLNQEAFATYDRIITFDGEKWVVTQRKEGLAGGPPLELPH